MFKKILLAMVLLISMNTVALAAAKVEQNAAIGFPIATVMTKEVQIVTDMFSGFDSLNYEKFSKDFSEDLKKIFTPEVFQSAQKDTIDKLGTFNSMNILLWQTNEADQADAIVYRGIFANDDNVLITVSLSRKDPSAIKITQVSFESPLMK